MINLQNDDLTTFDPAILVDHDRASMLTLEQTESILAAPDGGLPLQLDVPNSQLSDGKHTYPILGEVPILFPQRLNEFLGEESLDIPFARYDDALLQYFLISNIKQSHGGVNSPHDSVWYRRHLYRARVLLDGASGMTLDVGADDPEVSSVIFPPSVSYLGLDPLYDDKYRFRLIGVAEFLPLKTASCDNVCFLTSLDHVFDYLRALDEARRVLKPGGYLYIATLLWEKNAELYHDHLHFHHFRSYQIERALDGFTIDREYRYSWKGDGHRYGLYLRAKKESWIGSSEGK